MLNKVSLIGRLGKDPESRSFANGGKVVSFTLATSERWNDKASGEKKEATEWHNIQIFNEQIAGVAERFLRKGSQCYVEGKLKTRKWQDSSGNDKFTTEVVIEKFGGALVLLDSKSDGGAPRDQARQSATADLDDDCPF